MPEDMVDGNGNPVNALYGFCRFIGDFMEQVTPEYIERTETRHHLN